MSNLIKIDEEYKIWIQKVSQRYQQSQIKAAIHVNVEMLEFYWSLGKDIVNLHAEHRWGSNFFESLSNDMIHLLPNVKGFSVTNLRYMKRFYELFSVSQENLPQVGAENMPSVEMEILPQVGATLFSIPWGHMKAIIDKCRNNPLKASFYVNQVWENDWSRAVLLNFMDTELFERQGRAITNFKDSLPDVQSGLAQEMTKDPYSFDFLTIRKGYDEKELKDALMDNIQNFLLELGTGFAFVGREYRLLIGKTEEFLDMLFYNIRLHCYVVVEVKVVEFNPRDIGQLGTYVAAVNHILRKDGDNQTIGLIICKTKDNILAKYALESSSEPIGISEYQLNSLFPEDFKGSMPTIEEIEQELGY